MTPGIIQPIMELVHLGYTKKINSKQKTTCISNYTDCQSRYKDDMYKMTGPPAHCTSF